jgi:citrate lyase beta subunit
MDEKELLPWKVGSLMYVPALNTGVGEKVCSGAFPDLNSLAFCLEDAITEEGVKKAELQLVKTLAYMAEHWNERMPMLFVRVRNCNQFERLPAMLGELTGILTGVIFPKFDLTNAAEYCAITGKIESGKSNPLYIMPILESGSIMHLDSRKRTLLGLRELLDGCRNYVLNIRVGAMDFCNLYGLRRTITQTIYDIAVVKDVLTDILTVFANDYIVSAPVWEYFSNVDGDESWARGMENELQLDMANGFIGKTVIHPSQLPLVKKWLQPTTTDVKDARAVLDWKAGEAGIARSVNGNRMNELATHRKWAKKILILSEIYGERD